MSALKNLKVLIAFLVVFATVNVVMSQQTCFGQTGGLACSNGRGTCIATDVCQCNSGYSGQRCEITSCFGILSNATLQVCSGHGTCSSLNTCSCSTGYSGTTCDQPLCGGLTASDPSVCSGKGNCVSPNTCQCNPGFSGSLCDAFNCADLNNCNARGSCVGPNQCSCNSGSYGFACESSSICSARSLQFHLPLNNVNASLRALGLTPEVISGQFALLTNATTAPFGSSCNEALGLLGAYGGDLLFDRNYTLPAVFTLEFKFAQNKTATGSQVLMWMYDRSPSMVVRTTGSSIVLEIRNGLNISTVSIDKSYRDGSFHTVTIRRLSSINFDFAVDGANRASLNATFMNNVAFGNRTFYSLVLGHDLLYNAPFVGYIDEFKVWNCTDVIPTTCVSCQGANACANGECVGANLCKCNAGWTGATCAVPICSGVAATVSTVCSGRGSCTAPDTCVCNTNYFGNTCQNFNCLGVLFSNSTVCSGHGTCTGPDTCSCVSTYGGVSCQSPICFTRLSTDPLVCSGQGTCTGPDTCSCKVGYKNSDCSGTDTSQIFCFGTAASVQSVCNGRGRCTAKDTCSCDSGWSGSNCQTVSCFGVLSSSSTVCSGRGTCSDVNVCQCQSGFQGQNCETTQCFGLLSSNPSVCSGRGTCISQNNCLCTQGYGGSSCQSPTCNGIVSTSPSVCSSGGTCTGVNTCVCNGTRTGLNCEFFTCNGIPNTSPQVCNGRGSCTAPDVCSCRTNFQGSFCEISTCFGILSTNTASVCSGHGTCISNDTCSCTGNFAGPACSICKPEFNGANCDVAFCDPVTTCNNNGACSGTTCSCSGNYAGTYCNTCKTGFYGATCGVPCTAATTCSGNGVCSSTGTCTCNSSPTGGFWTGTSCNTCAGTYQGATCGFGVTTTSFASSGDRLTADVSFPGASNPIPCSSVIAAAATRLGTGATCGWPSFSTNPTGFEIILGSNPTVAVGETLTYTLGNFTFTVTIQGAASFPTPTAVMTTAPIVGDCDGITLDASLSASQDRRTLQSFIYTAVSGFNLAAIQTYLASRTTTSRLFIPTTLLPSGFDYVFSLRVVSFFGVQSGTTSVTVKKVAAAVPLASIEGTASQQVIPNSIFRLVGSANISSPCVSSQSSSLGLTFAWKQVSGPVIIQSIPDQRILYFPANSFPVLAASYVFELTVGSALSTQVSTAQVTLTVAPRPLVAIISGFSVGTVATANDLTLDATASYDPESSSTLEKFSWSCITSSGFACPAPFNTIPSSNFVKFTNPLPIGSFTFTLTYARDSRSATAKSIINVVQTQLYNSLWVVKPKGKLVRENFNSIPCLELSSSGLVNVLTPLKWTVQDDTTGTIILTSIQSDGYLALPPNSLSGNSLTYTIRAERTDASEVFSIINVEVNTAPLVGSITADPQIGDEATTTFTFTASNFIDVDAPLLFSFFAVTPSTSRLVLLGSSTSNTIVTTLPAGLSTNGNRLSVVVAVSDVYGASTALSTTVVVRPLADASALLSSVATLSSSTTVNLNGDPYAVSRFVSIIMAALTKSFARRGATTPRQTSTTVTAYTNLANLVVDNGNTALALGTPVTSTFLASQASAILSIAQQSTILSAATTGKLLDYTAALMKLASSANATDAALSSSTANGLCLTLSEFWKAVSTTTATSTVNALTKASRDFVYAIASRIPMGASQSTSCSFLNVLTQFESFAALNSKQINFAGASVLFPSVTSSQINSTRQGAVVHALQFNKNPYLLQPSYRTMNISNSTVVSVSLMNGANEVRVFGLSQSINITVPVSLNMALVNLDCQLPGITPVCRYWSDAANTWVADNTCSVVAVTATAVTCACNHLTDFVTTLDYIVPANVLIPPVDPNIVIKYKVYNPTTTVFSGVSIIAYIVFMIGFYIYDHRTKVRMNEFNDKEEQILGIGLFRTILEAIKKYHVYISIFAKPLTEKEHFPRTQRITVVFTILFTFMATNTLLLGTYSNTEKQPALFIVTAIFSNCIVLPIAGLVFYCFHNTKANKLDKPVRVSHQTTFENNEFDMEDIAARASAVALPMNDKPAPATAVPDNLVANDPANKKKKSKSKKPKAVANPTIKAASNATFDNQDFELDELGNIQAAPTTGAVVIPSAKKDDDSEATYDVSEDEDDKKKAAATTQQKAPIDDDTEDEDVDDEDVLGKPKYNAPAVQASSSTAAASSSSQPTPAPTAAPSNAVIKGTNLHAFDDQFELEDMQARGELPTGLANATSDVAPEAAAAAAEDSGDDEGNDDDVLPVPAHQQANPTRPATTAASGTTPATAAAATTTSTTAKSNTAANKKELDAVFRAQRSELRFNELKKIEDASGTKSRFVANEKLAAALDKADDAFDVLKLSGTPLNIIAIISTIVFYIGWFVLAGGLVALFHNTMQYWWQPYFTTLFMMLAAVIAIVIFEYVYLSIKYEKWRVEKRWKTSYLELAVLAILTFGCIILTILTLAVAGGVSWGLVPHRFTTGHILTTVLSELLVFGSLIVTFVLIIKKPSIEYAAQAAPLGKPWLAPWMPYIAYPLVWVFFALCIFLTIFFGLWMTPVTGAIWIAAYVLSFLIDILFTKFVNAVVMGYFMKMHFIAVEAVFYRAEAPKNIESAPTPAAVAATAATAATAAPAPAPAATAAANV